MKSFWKATGIGGGVGLGAGAIIGVGLAICVGVATPFVGAYYATTLFISTGAKVLGAIGGFWLGSMVSSAIATATCYATMAGGAAFGGASGALVGSFQGVTDKVRSRFSRHKHKSAQSETKPNQGNVFEHDDILAGSFEQARNKSNKTTNAASKPKNSKQNWRGPQ